MKAIKDCEWEVNILPYNMNGGYFWQAFSIGGSGLVNLEQRGFCQGANYAKRKWVLFANLNGIKKWKYI